MAAGASTDGEHTCAVKLDGSLWCWGANALGQLGVGSTTSSATPVQVGSATWTNVSGGAAHTCGVQGDGTLWCWGDNGYGQVGDGTLTNQRVPVQVPGQAWVQVAAGAGDTCGTRQDGSLWCWGDNDRGQIGNGTDTPEMTPRQVAPHQYGQVPICSNGTVEQGEQCDDGNTVSGDGCSSDCQVEKCFNHPECTPIDQCHVAGACDPATGTCSNPPQVDGTACDDQNPCTQGETCQGGACQGGVTPSCTAIDQCHDVGNCDPGTGICSNPPKDDASACDDGDPCTLDHCDPLEGCVHTPTSADGCSLSVQPKVTCVGTREDGALIAVFGYQNPNTASVNIPKGSDNSTSAPDEAIYPYLPEWFKPGTVSAAMAVDFQSGAETTWSLRGVTATANANSTPCPSVTSGTVTLPDGKTFVTDPGQSYQSGYADSILPSQPTAAIRGTFAVTDDGAATYRLPLWVPPGLMGMQPQLGLAYNSAGGDGFLGRGWQLQGLSQILRCRQDFARDGQRLPIQWTDDDRLCLDGQRLVLTKGTYNAAGAEYRTEHDRHVKIVQVGKDDLGPTGFVVYQPDGTRHSYGYDAAPVSAAKDFYGETTAVLDGMAATITVHDGTTDEPTVSYDTQVRYGWALASSRDRYDNRVQYSYIQQHSSDDLNRWTDFRPAGVNYTFNNLRDADREIAFEYTSEDGTDARVDTRFSFVSGLQLRLGHLLSKITMYGGASGRFYLVKYYSMQYEPQAARTSALLHSVQECDGSGICSQPAQFAWSSNDGTYEKKPTEEYAYRYESISRPGMLLTGDFNGDGRDDLAIGQYACLGGDCHGPNQYYSALASSSATELPFSGGGGFLEQDVAVLADLNGDGTTDLITGGGGQPANYRPEICKAGTCTGVWTPTSGATLPYVGDFDGDGLVDLIGPVTPANNPPTWGYLPNNSKTGFAAQYVSINTSYASTQTWNAYVNDYNGAGKAELIFWNSALLQNGTPSTFMHMLADTTSGALTTSLKASGKSLLSVRYQFADLNGDGLPDAIEIPNAGGDVRIAINTGRGFLPPKPANLNSDSMFGESSFRDPGIRIVDVNLDGRADILYLGDGCRGDGASSRSKIITLAADNDRDGSVSLVPDVSPYDHGWGTYPGNGVTCYGFDGSQVLDANGDGLADFIQAEGDDYQLMLYQRQGQPPGLLTNVRDGYGATVDVTYAPMSDSTVYTRIECSYPQICNQKGRWLVSSHTFDKGTSTERPLTHTYVGARADITGIGWLGMDRHTVTDGAITTTVDYDLDPSQNDDQVKTYPKIGRPVQKQEVFNDPPASALARTSIFDLGFHNVGFGDGNGRTWWRVVWDSDGVTTEETQHTQDNSQPPVIANRVIRKTSESRTYDPDFGYIKTRNGSKWGEGDGNGGDFEQESWVPSYYDDDEGNWLVGRLKREEAHSTIEGVEGVRVTSYELDPNTNALLSTIIEPDSGDPNLYKKTKLTRNLTGQVWKTDEYVLDPTTLTPTVARSTQVLQFDPVSGFPAFTRNALGQVTSRVYHPWLGVVVSETDANGLETRRKYDGFGRLRWEKTPDGGLTEMNYNAQDQTEPGALALLQVEATQNGVGPTLYYDAAGRLVRQVKLDENPNPYQTVIQYDKYGREVSKWRPYPGTKGNVVQSLPHLNTTYDSLGRPTLQEFVSGNPPTVSSRKSWTYDGLSTVAVESGLGLGPDKTTGTITGGGGRVFRATELVTVKGAGGTNETKLVTTQFFYRPFGQLGKVLVDQSNETDMTYDARGRRRTVKDGDTGTTTSDYDAFDQLTKETYQDTNWVSRSYDALGRMTSETTKGGGTNTTIWDASANGIGRVSVRTSMDGVATEFDYDAAGRASGETWRFGAEAHRVDYAHDQYGRLSRITYPDVAAQRRAVYYGYDPWTGEQSSASLGDSSGPKKMLWSVQARDFDRHILSESFGDGSEQHSVYGDPRGLLTSRSSLMAETDTGTTVGFTYDARGYLASRQQYLSDQGETFTHDEMGRLTTWQSTGGGANWKVEYGYDSIGNLLSREESLDGTSQGATTFVTGSTNQCQNPAGPHAITTVTSAGTTQCYEYDARGQQTSGADGRAVSYTEYGLPTQITRDGVQWQFGYDATHRRARKTGPAGSTIYVGSLYEKRVATDGTESHVMYVLAGGDVKAQIVVDGASGGQKIDYLMRDHLASVTRTGGDGVWQDMRFDPYGGRIATAPPPTPISESPSSRVRLGFTGQEEDDDLGLVNMNGRIYDPAIARFLTPDPVVAMRSPSQSWNRYSYAENSPLRFVDPSGFDPQDGSGGNGPPPGVHMECTSAFNCGYMTSSGVYLTQDNWNYWSGNYSTSPAGPNVGSFDEAGAGASAGITYGMAVASKDGESQGGGGSVGAEYLDLLDAVNGPGAETPQQRVDRVRKEYGIGTGSASDIKPLYVSDLPSEFGPARTIIDPTNLGSREAVEAILLGSTALQGSDSDLAVILHHEYSIHAEPAVAGTHPFDMSDNPAVMSGRSGMTATDYLYESYGKFQDAQYALSIGNWSAYESRMAASEGLMSRVRDYADACCW